MKLLKLVPDNTNIDFVRLRGWAFGLTLLLSVLAVGVTVARGLNSSTSRCSGRQKLLTILKSIPPDPTAW